MEGDMVMTKYDDGWKEGYAQAVADISENMAYQARRAATRNFRCKRPWNAGWSCGRSNTEGVCGPKHCKQIDYARAREQIAPA